MNKKSDEPVNNAAHENDNLQSENIRLQEQINDLKIVEERFRLAADHNPDMFIIYNPDKTIQFVDNKGVEFYGLHANDIVGRTDQELFSPDIELPYLPLLEEAIRSKELVQKYLEFELNNIRYYLDLRYIPITDKNGDLRQVLCIAKDLKEQIVAQRKIEGYIQELKSSHASKDKFFSIIAKNLKEPFLGLLELSEMLGTETEELTNEEVREFALRMHKHLKSSFTLIENLLDWARMQTGRFSFNPCKFSLTLMLKEALDLKHSAIEGKNIQVETEFEGNLEVFADQYMAQAVVRNLISNAVKFTPDGGRITLKGKEKEDFITVSVSDTGKGIAADVIDKLFRIDEQVQLEGDDEKAGTGLGLILSKEFLNKNGGKIWVESEVDKGSTFLFTLPKADS